MSYDIYIGDENYNYTSNLAKLFYDHIPAAEEGGRGGLHELHGKTGKQAGDILADAFTRIDRSAYRNDNLKGFCARYDAPNGWGSTVGALLFLSCVMAACYRNPRKRVRICA